MPEQQVRVTFQPSGRTVSVFKGTRIVEAAARAGLAVNSPCGGGGTCGKCRVQVLTGAQAPNPTDSATLQPAALAQGWRLACQTDIVVDSVVHVPDSSRLHTQHQIVVSSESKGVVEIKPTVRQVRVEMSPPTLEDSAADVVRLEHHLGPVQIDLFLLKNLSGLLQQGQYCGTAVLVDDCLIDFLPGDTQVAGFGVAVDIGTTTLAGLLVALEDGREVAVTSRMNPQVRFGDDVLARIQYATEHPEGLQELQQIVLLALNEMIADLCEQAGLTPNQIYEVTMAGNTTMQHLLCGLDPAPLGQIPFTPTSGDSHLLRARDLSIDIHTCGKVYVFPVMGGFVGGDTVAGILAAQLGEATDPVLMIDIGTNGEIVLAHNGKLWVASTAAGPAFEGARIHCGMRATRGAIEKVMLTEDVTYNVIGDAEPMGICGSALIDLMAELLRLGLVDPTGRLLPPEDLPDHLPGKLKQRVTRSDISGLEFFLAESQGVRVTLTERDVREMQLAIGAIRAGMVIMMKKAALKAEDLTQVLVAGGFGVFVRRDKAQAIGLLPPGVPHERIRHVGNTALAGAKLALLSTTVRANGEKYARTAEHVELSLDLDFQREFAEAMLFPEPS